MVVEEEEVQVLLTLAVKVVEQVDHILVVEILALYLQMLVWQIPVVVAVAVLLVHLVLVVLVVLVSF